MPQIPRDDKGVGRGFVASPKESSWTLGRREGKATTFDDMPLLSTISLYHKSLVWSSTFLLLSPKHNFVSKKQPRLYQILLGLIKDVDANFSCRRGIIPQASGGEAHF